MTQDGDSKRSEKHEAGRNTLPENLRSIFDQFVDDYKFASTIHHGSPFVSYIILAEMIKAGWRPSGEPIGQWKGCHPEASEASAIKGQQR